MYLSRLYLRSAPGLPNEIRLEGLSAGLILLLGPNASGKSTIGRILRGALWPATAPADIDARTTWTLCASGETAEAITVFGHTRWSGPGVPLPEPLAHACQLSLPDLLRPDLASDRQIAQQIQTQLDGGYDLSALRPSELRHRPALRLKRPYTEAESRLRTLLDQTDALARQEAQLQALHHAAADAALAFERLEILKKAQKRLDLSEELAKRKAERTSMPADIAQVPDDAAKQAEKLARRVEAAEEDHERWAKAEARARQAVESLAFPGQTPTLAVLDAWVREAERLERNSDALAERAAVVAGLRSAEREAAGQVWVDADTDRTIDKRMVEALEQALATVRKRQAALDACPDVPEIAEEVPTPAQLQRLFDARSMLREWLAAPRPLVPTAAGPALPAWMVVLGGLGALLILVGAALLILWPAASGAPSGLLAGMILIALGMGLVGLAVGAWIGTRPTGGTSAAHASPADAIAERYIAAGHPTVAAWTVTEVDRTLDGIDRRIALGQRAVQAAENAQRIRQMRTRRTRELEEAQAELRRIVAALELSPDLPALELIHQADRLRQLAEAQRQRAEEEAALAAEREAFERDLAVLRRRIDALAIVETPTPDDAIGLRATVEQIRERARKLDHARTELHQAQEELCRAKDKLDKEKAELNAFLAACGVTLATTGELPRREALAKRARELDNEINRLQAELARLDATLPADLPADRESLTAETNAQRAKADKLEELHARIAEIKQAISLATRGDSIRQAVADRAAALDELVRDRDQQLEVQVTEALRTWLMSERDRHDTPALLDRARKWFLTFTHNRYELRVDPVRAFIAHDLHSGRYQTLSELSDGTRVQLLLAARLAYIEATEGEVRIPLFLDEALSTADPERFEAIASAVLAFASTDRQVFYATTDPVEVETWRRIARAQGRPEPQVVVLGEDDSTAAWTPPPEPPQARRAWPDVADLDAVGWCAAAGLPRPGLADEVGRWPLALVLHDHLDAARHAAEAGVHRVEQLDIARWGVPLPLPEPLRALAEARVRVIRSAVEAMRIGRGRPVTWAEVEASQAVSTTFAERVRNLVPKHGHDPVAFLKAVKELPRFRSHNVEQLRAHLESLGVLDPRPPLSRSETVRRAWRAAANDVAARTLTLAEVEALVSFVADVVGLGEQFAGDHAATDAG